MSGSTSTPPYATAPLGLNGAPIMEFIQPLPQAIVQLTFPSVEQLLAESLAASGVTSTNTSGTAGFDGTVTASAAGALASLDPSQGVFMPPMDFA